MKATIEGIIAEGNPKEIAEFYNLIKKTSCDVIKVQNKPIISNCNNGIAKCEIYGGVVTGSRNNL